MSVHLVLAAVQVMSGLAGLVLWLRYRRIHRCAVCGKHPLRLYRCTWGSGWVERRCAEHLESVRWTEG